MSTENKILIRQAILFNPNIAQGLKGGSTWFDDAITEFSGLTGLPEIFLRQNIDQIRNWI